MKVLAAVKLCADPASGLVSNRTFNPHMIAVLTQLPEDKVQPLLDVLIATGAIEERGGKLFVTGAEPVVADH
jgi:hypothetical protein